jgi:hypothetical protein
MKEDERIGVAIEVAKRKIFLTYVPLNSTIPWQAMQNAPRRPLFQG